MCKYTPTLLTGLTPNLMVFRVSTPNCRWRSEKSDVSRALGPHWHLRPVGLSEEVEERELGWTLWGGWEGATRKLPRALSYPYNSPSTCTQTRPPLAVHIPVCRLLMPHRDMCWSDNSIHAGL